MKQLTTFIISIVILITLSGCGVTHAQGMNNGYYSDYTVVYYDYMVDGQVSASGYVWDGCYSYHLMSPVTSGYWVLCPYSREVWLYGLDFVRIRLVTVNRNRCRYYYGHSYYGPLPPRNYRPPHHNMPYRGYGYPPQHRPQNGYRPLQHNMPPQGHGNPSQHNGKPQGGTYHQSQPPRHNNGTRPSMSPQTRGNYGGGNNRSNSHGTSHNGGRH